MSEPANAKPPKIPIGVSSCLLGERVRYDGGHKLDGYIAETLGDCFELRAFCPEMAIGLGVPRKPIRLRAGTPGDSEDTLHCVAVDNNALDFTRALRDCADGQRAWMQGLCGYILKKGSPSCGMERVPVWRNGESTRTGVGIFARRLMENFPCLPVEEEGRLADPTLRENFIQRVFALWRWHDLLARGLTVGGLTDFHARYKLVLMSRNQQQCRRLGRFVAEIDHDNLHSNAPPYLHAFMDILKIKASRANHVNVLQHVQGYLKSRLDAHDKRELARIVERYRTGELPLSVPVTRLNHFFGSFPDQYIARSWYMNPGAQEQSLYATIQQPSSKGTGA